MSTSKKPNLFLDPTTPPNTTPGGWGKLHKCKKAFTTRKANKQKHKNVHDILSAVEWECKSAALDDLPVPFWMLWRNICTPCAQMCFFEMGGRKQGGSKTSGVHRRGYLQHWLRCCRSGWQPYGTHKDRNRNHTRNMHCWSGRLSAARLPMALLANIHRISIRV